MSIESIKAFFSSSDFMPHIHCYLARPSLVWTMFTSDTLIGLAYVSISLSLYALVRKIRLPFSPMFLAFGLFIFACGMTHFMEVYTLWIPAYWLAALVKVVTAIASILTAIYLIRIAPEILLFAEAAKESEQKGINLAKQAEVLAKTIEELKRTQDRFHMMIQGVKDYAIYMLDPEGRIEIWNEGAKHLKQYEADEVIGKSFSMFYTPEAREKNKPRKDLLAAKTEGRFEDTGWILRKDGTRFWANIIITPLFDTDGILIGFSKVTRDLTESKRAEDDLKTANRELENVNKELEAFSYSVSHDLRAPLRSLDGFSRIILTNYFDSLDETGKDYLRRIRAASQKMGQLIDALLSLSRVSRTQMKHDQVDLSSEVRRILEELKQSEPTRIVNIIVADGVMAVADTQLTRILLQNLLSNAWKFTSKKENPTIEFGVINEKERPVYFVKDTGAGFDMAYSDKLFGAFQRLHSDSEFEGTGIGLVTVQRIVHRHGGEVWVQAKLGEGATFFFTLQMEDKK